MKNATLLLVVGLFIGSSAVALAGNEEIGNRQCARTLCSDLRNCSFGGQGELVDKGKSTPTDFVSKKSKNEDTQGFDAESCREEAWQVYLFCLFEGGEEDIRVRETPVEKKSVNVTPTND